MVSMFNCWWWFQRRRGVAFSSFSHFSSAIYEDRLQIRLRHGGDRHEKWSTCYTFHFFLDVLSFWILCRGFLSSAPSNYTLIAVETFFYSRASGTRIIFVFNSISSTTRKNGVRLLSWQWQLRPSCRLLMIITLALSTPPPPIHTTLFYVMVFFSLQYIGLVSTDATIFVSF